MPENFALYSSKLSDLPIEQMRVLVPGLEPNISLTDRGLTFRYSWPDLLVLCSQMPRDEIAEHLRGFQGYVRHLSPKSDDRTRRIITAISRVRLVVGVEIHPQRDAEGRGEEFVGKLAFGLEPIIFFEDALYDHNSHVLLALDGHFDPRGLGTSAIVRLRGGRFQVNREE